MKSFKYFISEELITPPDTPNTLTLWHGGRLDSSYDETINHKKGRWEYGSGLYCVTHYQTARKYAKGSRRLYMITIAKGNDAGETLIPVKEVLEFIKRYTIASKRKEVIEAINRRTKGDSILAETFNTIMVNYDAIKSSNTNTLRVFLVNNGVDYLTVDNPFGWHERMIVLFNMKKIVSKRVITPKDKIEVFNLPTEWR
jgi:hypothetical protein